MKKLFTVLAVLLVATALFAGVTVKAGGTFAFVNQNSTVVDGEKTNIKAHGFGFGVGAQYDVADNLAAYAEFNMEFPKDALLSEDGEEVKASEMAEEMDATHRLNFFSISAGVAYKLDFDAVKLAVGGGLTFNRAGIVLKAEEGSIKLSSSSIGLNVLVDAKYMFTENIGAGVTLNPQLGLYNIMKYVITEDDESETEKINGFAIGFAMPITVGVSYTF